MNQPLAYVHPGAKIARNVVIDPFTTIHNNVEIGEGTIIGAGAVVAKSLPPNCTAVGIPAKPVKFHTVLS